MPRTQATPASPDFELAVDTVKNRLAERELRKLLAPLLKAMKGDDPEVRRRARRSILSLVPGDGPEQAWRRWTSGAEAGVTPRARCSTKGRGSNAHSALRPPRAP